MTALAKVQNNRILRHQGSLTLNEQWQLVVGDVYISELGDKITLSLLFDSRFAIIPLLSISFVFEL